ncbi:MAG TPA: SAF domain-containing protein, partial [Vicinamibacterales bacterium]|nr:SAF domain-containing protein [Vicinamibacterales bacterium]
HVTMSRGMFGPDVPASVTIEELRQLVDGVRFVERMRANPLDKDASARETDPLRRLFTKSVVARRALATGTVLSTDDLAIKKPGTGLSPDRLSDLVGKKLARAVDEDQLLVADDIEGLQ